MSANLQGAPRSRSTGVPPRGPVQAGKYGDGDLILEGPGGADAWIYAANPMPDVDGDTGEIVD